jgi:hypothetical protein
MRKLAIATIVRTVGTHYEYAAALPDGNFFVSNGDAELTEDDFDKPAVVSYTPDDQFCTVIPLYKIQRLISMSAIHTSPKRKDS